MTQFDERYEMASREGSVSKFRELITRPVKLPSWVLSAFLVSWMIMLVKSLSERSFGETVMMLIAMITFAILVWVLPNKLRQRRGTTSGAAWTGDSRPMWFAAIVVMLTIVNLVRVINLIVSLFF